MTETVAQAFERFSALSKVFDPSHDALSDRARFCNEPYTGDIHTDFSQLFLEIQYRRMVMLFCPGRERTTVTAGTFQPRNVQGL